MGRAITSSQSPRLELAELRVKVPVRRLPSNELSPVFLTRATGEKSICEAALLTSLLQPRRI
jgi:hypothetical protein